VTLAGEYILGTHCDNSCSEVICGLGGWSVIASRGIEILLLIHITAVAPGGHVVFWPVST
jgi:hypothetical protein